MLMQILLVLLFWMNGVPPYETYPDNPKKIIAKNEAKGYIPWQSSRKLTWNDFQSAVDANDPLHAMTSTNISVQANCQGNVVQFEVKCQFALHESWSKNKGSEILLQHEQLHFDLTEIYARQLRQKLSQLKNLCTSDRSKFNVTVNKVFADWKKEQNRYDTESDHGLNDEKQLYWSEQIAARLQELAAYQANSTNETAGL